MWGWLDCRRRRWIWMKSCHLFLRQEIRDTANRVDLYLRSPLEKLFSETMDVHFDGIRGDVTGLPKNVIFDQFLGDDAVSTTHQKFEDRRFAGRQNLRFVVDECLSAFGVECEIRNLKRTSEQLARAPQECFQPGHQFFERKRLDEIVIRTGAKTGYAIMQTTACRQH